MSTTANITTTTISNGNLSSNLTAESSSNITFASPYTTAGTATIGIQGTISDNTYNDGLIGNYLTVGDHGMFQWTDYLTTDDCVAYYMNKYTNDNIKKDEEKMNEFNFGPYNNTDIRLSPYGIAIKNKMGKYVSYDKEKERIIDVDILNIEIDPKKIFFKVPRPIKDIKPGDLIIHNNTLMFVEYTDEPRIAVVDPAEGTEKRILPALSPFGYDYIPVIISLTDYLPAADENNPFGGLLLAMAGGNNMMPLLLAQGLDFNDIDPITLLALSNNNSSLLLLLQLMKKKDNEPKYANKDAADIAKKIEIGRKNAKKN